MEVWGGVGGGWRGGTMQIKFASVIMQPPPPTHSPPSPVSQAHAVPWRRANHFKRLRNTAALSSRRRSIHFLFYIFYLNSLLHSCLNLFQSGAVETDLQVAAELYLGGVASCPVHMPTREARGRELSIKSPLQTCGRSRNERQKKKIMNKRADCADQEVHMWCTSANSDQIVSGAQLAHSYNVCFH